jgi:hypothetical protein
MRVIFNFSDELEEVPLGRRITFGKLDFIADWFGDLCVVDITPSDAPADPPTIMQGPMTRARMRQLNLEVSLFLSDPFHTFENRLLPNDIILLRNIGEGHDELRGRGGGEDDQQGRPTQAGGPVQHDFESVAASRISLP